MRHFSRYADALAQRRVRVNCLGDIDCIGTHFDCQRDLTNHVRACHLIKTGWTSLWRSKADAPPRVVRQERVIPKVSFVPVTLTNLTVS